MTRNQMECGGVDDEAGWDETWCDDYPACFGRLGDWITDLIAACESPMGVAEPTGQTPAEAFCGAMEAPTGWGDVDCYDEGVIAPTDLCYGSHGIYYPAWGLLPTCEISDEIDQNPNYTPIALEDAIATFCN